jgi:hypothetical protein
LSAKDLLAVVAREVQAAPATDDDIIDFDAELAEYDVPLDQQVGKLMVEH